MSVRNTAFAVFLCNKLQVTAWPHNNVILICAVYVIYYSLHATLCCIIKKNCYYSDTYFITQYGQSKCVTGSERVF